MDRTLIPELNRLSRQPGASTRYIMHASENPASL